MSDKGQGGDKAAATVGGGRRRQIWFNTEPNHGLILKPGSGMGWVTHLGKQYLGRGILTGTRCDRKVGFCGITELVQDPTLSWSCLMVLHSWDRSRSWGCSTWSQPGWLRLPTLCVLPLPEPTRKVSPTSFSPRHQDPGMTPQAPHPSAALLLLAPQIFPITLKGYPPRQQDLHGTRVQAGL